MTEAATSWQWSNHTSEDAKAAYACVLWTLHLDGPIESATGRASSMLRARLKKRKGVYTAAVGQAPLANILRRLTSAVDSPYTHSIARTTNGTLCLALRCDLTPEQLPANPYSNPEVYRLEPAAPAAPTTAPVAKARRNGHGPPVERLDPLDALAAIRGLVDEALGHGLSATDFVTAERLADALAQVEQLRHENMTLQTALLERLRETESLRRSLGAAQRRRG